MAASVETPALPFEEGEEEPRPDAFLAAAGRKVRSSLDHLVETDFAVIEAEGWESTLRRQFNEINEAHRASDRARIARSRARDAFLE